MVMFVNGRRVITNAPGAIVRSVSKNYTTLKRREMADFENVCKSEDLQNCCEDVLVDGYAVATIDSFFPHSYGDEKGVGGGVKSGTINGKGVFKTASPDVFVSSLDGTIVKAPVVREGDLVVSNEGNCEPAPIEYLPGYQIQNPCQTPKLETKESKTNYHMSLVVHGRNQHFYGHFVNYCPTAKSHEQAVLGTSENKSDINGLAKRLYLKNVGDEKYGYGFYQNSENAKRIAISFLGEENTLESMDNASPKKAFSDEPMQVVLLRLVMDYQLPQKSLANVAPQDFSDIFRLSDGLRARVYQSLMLYKLTVEAALFEDESKESIAKDSIEWADDYSSMQTLKEFKENWYEIISTDLQESVDEELSTKIIGSVPEGFIYIYLNGYIWREIEIRKGKMHEIDLRVCGGTNNRKSTGLAQEDLMLPYKIAGNEVEVEVAYSFEQWSWGRIQYYGGMSEKDERRVNKLSPVVKDRQRAKEHRSKRFINIELKSLIKDKKTEVLNDKGGMQLFEAFNIYHLVLPNPLLPIHRAMNDIFHMQNELQTIVENVHNPVHCAHGSSASLIYKYFFNPKDGLLAKQKTTNDIKKAFSQRRKKRLESMNSVNWTNKPRDKDDVNDDIRSKIDLDKIKATLKVERRQRIRDLIRVLQSSLVSLVQNIESEKKIVDTKPILVGEAMINWQDCIKDWFAGDIKPYAHAFYFIGTLSNALNLEPSHTDSDMDLERDIDLSKSTPGSQFIVSLHDKSHPLYELIEPNDKAINQAKKLPAVQLNEHFSKSFNDYKNTGEDLFNIHFFKFISAIDSEVGGSVMGSFNSVIKDMASNLQESLSKEAGHQSRPIDRAHTLLSHYMLVVDNAQMPKTEAKLLSEVDEADHIIGMPTKDIDNHSESLATSTVLAKERSSDKVYASSSTQLEVEHSHNKEFFDFSSEKESVIAKQKSQLFEVKNNNWQLEKADVIDHMVITTKDEKYFDSELFNKKSLHLIDKGSSMALSVFALWNVKSKIEALNKEKEGSNSKIKKAELYEALFAMSFTLENIARSYSSQKIVDDWYKKQSSTIHNLMNFSSESGFLFTPLSALATFGSTINIGLSIKSIYNTIQNHSPQLLVPELSKLGINVGTTLSFLGTAAERSLEKETIKKLSEYAAKNLFQELTATELKKKALQEALELTTHSFARKSLMRFVLPFANTYVGIFLMLSGFLIDYIIEAFKDSELLAWLKSSPFVLEKYANSPKNEAELLLEFANIISRPQACLNKTDDYPNKIRYFVDITLPYFDIDHHKIQLAIYGQTITLDNSLYGGFPSVRHASLKYSEPYFFRISQKEVFFDDSLQVLKVRFYLHSFNNIMHRINTDVKIMCQYRIILEDGTSLPLEKYHGHYLKKHALTMNDEAHVFHAKPIYVSGNGPQSQPSYLSHEKTTEDKLKQKLSKKVEVIS